MDPRRVLTFRAVAHARSFTAAARELALTQPAVSQQVAGLEAELGTPLLVREPGGLRLTRAGEVLLAHADVVAERLGLARAPRSPSSRRRARAAADRRVLERARRPRAGAGRAAAANVAGRRGARPGGRQRRAGAIGCLKGELHLSLAFQDASLPRREHDGLERRDVLREPFLVAVARGPPARGSRRTIDLAELSDDPWSAASTDGLIARACEPAGFTPRIVAIAARPDRDPRVRRPRHRGHAGAAAARAAARRPRASLDLTGEPPQPRRLRAAAPGRAPPARRATRSRPSPK